MRWNIITRRKSGSMLPAIAVAVTMLMIVGSFYYFSVSESGVSNYQVKNNNVLITRKTITVDGDPSDWTGTAPGTDNTHTISNAEWIWKDASGDERTDATDPDSNYDMTEVRITGDTTNIYFLIRMAGITDTGLPVVMIAVDTDQTDSSGAWWLPETSDTGVSTGTQETTAPGSGRSGSANWESCIYVSVQSTGYYDTSFNFHTAGHSYISSTNNLIEISMPWSSLGIDPSTSPTVRFEVASFSNDGSGGVQDIGGSSISDALDVVTDYAISGGGTNTWDEVKDDQDIDYYFDIQFSTSGEPVPELSNFVFPFMTIALVSVMVWRRKTIL